MDEAVVTWAAFETSLLPTDVARYLISAMSAIDWIQVQRDLETNYNPSNDFYRNVIINMVIIVNVEFIISTLISGVKKNK